MKFLSNITPRLRADLAGLVLTPRSSIGNIERYMLHCRSFPIRRNSINQSINQTSIAPISLVKPGSVVQQLNQINRLFFTQGFVDQQIDLKKYSKPYWQPLKRTKKRNTASQWRNSVLSGFSFSLLVYIHDWTETKHDCKPFSTAADSPTPLMQKKLTAGYHHHRGGEG